MVIVQDGLNRMAVGAASTWLYIGFGQGTATVLSTDVWLQTSVLVASIDVYAPFNNSCTFNRLFEFSEGNTTATVTEIIVADQSTDTGNILLRSVASTNTWASFVKNSDIMVLANVNLVISA